MIRKGVFKEDSYFVFSFLGLRMYSNVEIMRRRIGFLLCRIVCVKFFDGENKLFKCLGLN